MDLKSKYHTGSPSDSDVIEYINANYQRVHSRPTNSDEHRCLVDTLLETIRDSSGFGFAETELGLWDKPAMWESLAFSEALLFSILPHPQSIRALCLFGVHKKVPLESHRHDREFRELMAPVLSMYEMNTFLHYYEAQNPESFKVLSKDRIVLPGVSENIGMGLVLLRHEVANMWYKGLGEYLENERLHQVVASSDFRELSVFTRINIISKLICFYSNLGRLKEVMQSYDCRTNPSEMMERARFSDLTLLQGKKALEILVVEGCNATAEFIATELTNNASLLY